MACCPSQPISGGTEEVELVVEDVDVVVEELVVVVTVVTVVVDWR